jgi:hypothetical protein
MHLEPFRLPVQVQRIAIWMVVRRNEVRVLMLKQKVDHGRELPRKVYIIILGEINDFAIILSAKKLDLLCEGPLIAHAF